MFSGPPLKSWRPSGVRGGKKSYNSRVMFRLIMFQLRRHGPFSLLCSELGRGETAKALLLLSLAWCCLLGTTFSLVSKRWVYSRGFPESQIIVPEWAHSGCEAASLGDRIWEVGVGPVPVPAGVRLLETVGRRTAEKLDAASLSGTDDTLL